MNDFEKPFGNPDEIEIKKNEFDFSEILLAQHYKIPLIETCKNFKKHILNDTSFFYWNLKNDKPIIVFKEIDYSFKSRTVNESWKYQKSDNDIIPAPTSDTLIKLIKEELEVRYPEVYHKLLFQLNQNRISLIIAGNTVAIENIEDSLFADSLARLYLRILNKQIYYHS